MSSDEHRRSRTWALGAATAAASLAWLLGLIVAGYQGFPTWGIGIVIAYAVGAFGAWHPAARIALALSPVILLGTLFTMGLYFAFPASPALILLGIGIVLVDGGRKGAHTATRASAAVSLICGIGLGVAYLYLHFNRAPGVHPAGAKATVEAPSNHPHSH